MSAQSVVLGALAVALFVSGTSAQEIYRWRDAQGTIHFADKPPSYPADVTLLDGQTSPPTAPTPHASQTKSSRSSANSYLTSSGQPTASRNAPANRSINSLIESGPRSRLRPITTDAASAESPGTNSGTTLSDLSSQDNVVRKSGRAAAARRKGPADDLAVPSLDGALSQNLSADGGSGTTSSRSRRPPTPPSLSPLETAGP